jgi:hypothetical protein
MIPVLAALLVGAPQEPRFGDPLPTLRIADPVFGGLREVVVGARPVRDTTMTLIQMGEISPQTYTGTASGGSTFGSTTGGTITEFAMGYVRWSVLPEVFGGQKCRVVKSDAISKPKLFNGSQILVQGQRSYWITEDNKILRQTELRSDPRGWRKASCIYKPESIDVEIETAAGKTRYNLFPADMASLHAQFEPLWDSGRILKPEKEYAILDPFRRTFDKVKVRADASFAFKYMNIPFEGHTFLITSGDRSERVYVSKENDLVKIEMPKGWQLVLGNPPESKEGPYWRAGAKPGDGSGQ